MANKFAPDPAQLRQMLEMLTHERETADDEPPKMRRILGMAIRALRAVAQLGTALPSEEAANELRGFAAEMHAELDDTVVPSGSAIAARTQRVVEYLSESPANVSAARDEVVKVAAGMCATGARLMSGGMAGRSDLEGQELAAERRRLVEALERNHSVLRLANELSTELTHEPVDLADSRAKAQALCRAADDLVSRQGN